MDAASGIPPAPSIDESTQDVWLLRAVSSETAVLGADRDQYRTRLPFNSSKSRRRRVEAILEEVVPDASPDRYRQGDGGSEVATCRRSCCETRFTAPFRTNCVRRWPAIRGSASVLAVDAPGSSGSTGSLAGRGHSEETAELDGFIQNLLNATRVTAGGVNPHLEWADPRDIVNAALSEGRDGLSAHRIEAEFAEDLPLVNVDFGPIEESFGQLLENAAKYSPSGSTVSVNGKCRTGRVILSISDQGVGITPDEQRTAWPQVVSQPAPSGNHYRIRPGLLDRIDLCRGKRRDHRHIQPWTGIGNHGFHFRCPLPLEPFELTALDK